MQSLGGSPSESKQSVCVRELRPRSFRMRHMKRNAVVQPEIYRAASGALRSGQSIIEFALILPLVLLLVVNVVNFGVFFYDWITIANAARAGAQYMIMAGASVNAPEPVGTTIIQNLIKQNDVLSLINSASVTVNTCTNNSGVYLPTTSLADQTGKCTTSGGNTGTLADPEAPLYVLAVVDVSYPYNPMIPLWDFPGLHIHATLPPTTIHRRAVMRMIQ